jgi:apolipoprotein D and lipocalin family protein
VISRTRTRTGPVARRAGARLAPLLLAPLLALGCISHAGVGPNADRPLETVPYVDLDRFGGIWYVIASMATSAEEGAHDAIELYEIHGPDDIDVLFHFRKGSFDGPVETIPQQAWVHDEATNAEWRVRPFWPLRLAYLVIDLAPDYRYTVVGHPSKAYVWIMARQPTLDPADRRAIEARLRAQGYDVDRIRDVPQRPLGARPPPPTSVEEGS